jgi:hypothetical protein
MECVDDIFASQRLWDFPTGNLVPVVFSFERDCFVEGRLLLALLTCLPGTQGSNRDCSHSFSWNGVGDVVSQRRNRLLVSLVVTSGRHLVPSMLCT